MSTMTIEHSRVTKARYFVSLLLAYAATAMLVTYIVRPGIFPSYRGNNVLGAQTVELPKPPPPSPQITSGVPVKIQLAKFGLNLPVDPGIYNSINHTWTLSPDRAHFAEPSMPPNNKQGNTLIYGHNNDYVFGLLRNISTGDVALITTENGHKFYYAFVSAENVKPDNMTVFQYDGPPTLVIQTCTGNWNEWRRLYTFKLQRVE